MNIAIIGQGNVAWHLRQAFAEAGLAAIPVNSHTPQALPGSADVVFLAVSDHAISEVASRLPKGDFLLVHLSGTTPLDVLRPYAARYAVAWPMQTLSRGSEVDYERMPFFLEASDDEALSTLIDVLSGVSTNLRPADTARRERLHLASVFANNFVNHLYACAEKLLEDTGETFETIRPLIAETFAKVCETTPSQAQTGPAAREDFDVIARHMSLLADKPELQSLYQILSDSIISKKQG